MNERQVDAIVRWNVVLGGILILGAVVFFQRLDVVLGVTIGAVLAAANFWGLVKLVRTVFSTRDKRKGAVHGLLIAKMGLLFFAVFLAMRFLPISAPGLAVGLSVILLSMIIESLRHALRGDAGVADDTRTKTNG